MLIRPQMIRCKILLLPGLTLTMLFGYFLQLDAQNSSGSANLIIEKIRALESVRDPKCYATASRLEDFMYGTPLSQEARNLKIEVQKEVALFLRDTASALAASQGEDSIRAQDVLVVIDSMNTVARMENGDLFFGIDSGYVRIKAMDFRQYASVAYSYRALLSVEQDLFFMKDQDFLPLTEPALDHLSNYLNLFTLASLQLADAGARNAQLKEITADIYRSSCIRVLKTNKHRQLAAFQYPVTSSRSGLEQQLLRQIIDQKLASYSAYNQLNQSVFLRNIQVFFARQKWPVESEASDRLRQYFLESLIAFTRNLLDYSASVQAEQQDQDLIIRLPAVQLALQQFLPHELNDFEDVIYFPGSTYELQVESYDLDAFRDGGIHWRILDYALQDAAAEKWVLDPHAAELVVEGVAQLGVLVLRLAGQASHQSGKETLDLDDMEAGFLSVQASIDGYFTKGQKESTGSTIASSGGAEVTGRAFSDVTQDVGISFEHKSADWLSRFIRGYVYSDEDHTAKLAIPPAFGGSGVAAEDFNNDGWMDILLLGGLGNRLYLNDGKGGFDEVTSAFDVNLWDEQLKSFGEPRQPIVADFDNDGWQDLFISYVNHPHQLYRNLEGRRFELVSGQAGLGGEGAVAGPATALDYDGDGRIDLFIGYFGNYLNGQLPTLSRNNQNGDRNRLFRNLGGMRFEEVAFTRDTATDNGWTQAVGHSDINQDGRQDIIVGNDFGVNRYYLNTSDRGFVEMSRIWKTDKPSYTMNVGIGDLNRDQFPDLYISNIVVMQKDEKYVSPNENTTMKFDPEKMANIRTIEANDLFLSRIEGEQFQQYELSDAVGPGFSATGWSWDADFFDYDNDGDEDLYCLNGMNDFRVYSTENPYYYGSKEKSETVSYADSDREKNVFFVNENGILVNRSQELGTDLLSNARSASYLDFDEDGDLDMVINNYHDAATVLRNDLEVGRHWMKITLQGDPKHGVNRDAIGSSLVLKGSKSGVQWREIHSTTGYLSVHPKQQHVGLGEDEAVEVEVRWSNGKTVNLGQLPGNKSYRIQYPDHIQEK